MLVGTVTLVTGGASGLGKACAERFYRQGGHVIICDLKTSKGAEVAKSIGEKLYFIAADVTSEPDVIAVLKFVKDKFGRLDYVINSAGIVAPHMTYDFKKNVPHPLDDFNRVIQVNVCGTFNVTRLAAGLMGENKPDKDGGRGVIINISSIAGFDGPRGLVSYTASKGAVNGMTLTLARDLSCKGIRVNTIAPGFFTSPMLHDELEKDALEKVIKTIPFPSREGHPDEFAQFVQSVIENPMLNGSTYRLDGGLRITGK